MAQTTGSAEVSEDTMNATKTGEDDGTDVTSPVGDSANFDPAVGSTEEKRRSLSPEAAGKVAPDAPSQGGEAAENDLADDAEGQDDLKWNLQGSRSFRLPLKNSSGVDCSQERASGEGDIAAAIAAAEAEDDKQQDGVQAGGTSEARVSLKQRVVLPDGTKGQTRVKFNPFADICEINHRMDIPRSIVGLMWWNGVELCNMRPVEKEIKKLMTSCGEDCIRGLEIRTPAGYRKRLKHYISAGLAVIDEQEFQQQERFNDPDTLATIYGHETRKCRIMAHIKGLMDEAYVNEHVYDRESSEQVREAIYNRKFASLRMCNCFFNELKNGDRGQHDALAAASSSGLLARFLFLLDCRRGSRENQELLTMEKKSAEAAAAATTTSSTAKNAIAAGAGGG